MSVDYATVIATGVDDDAPRYGRNASGYGFRIPTRYKIQLDGDARWRRVYAISVSNAASFYVTVKGQDLFLRDSDLMP